MEKKSLGNVGGGDGERNMNTWGGGLECFTFISSFLNLEQVEVGLLGKNMRHPVKSEFQIYNNIFSRSMSQILQI